jgi:hypothetical protein
LTKQWRAVPQYGESLIQKGNTSSAYYRWIQDIEIGTPPAQEATITVTASPFTYVATRGGFVIIDGGTVSIIQFTRTNTYTTGLTKGTIPVSLGDQVTVTYSGAPTMTFVPT